MIYGLAVALLMAAGGRATEWLARGAGKPVRWVWAAAMFATLALSIAAAGRALRAASAPPTHVVLNQSAKLVADNIAQPTLGGRLAAAIVTSQQLFNDALARATALTQRSLSPTFVAAATAFWALGGILLLATFAMVQRRMRRARDRWPIARVAGARVRISPTVGPLVAGVVRPEIVVPRWVLDRASDEQGMVIAHEAEHVRAHDPALLSAAWMALALMPWNPALWYMYARLRLAVEIDCDARVLRVGSAAPGSYGALLIDVAEQASLLRLSALALADDTSHLHQRIMAMKPTRVRFALVRGGAAVLLGSVALLAACAAEAPTAADIQRLDASTAATAATRLAFAKTADTLDYIVDGAPMSAEQARAIAPADIDRMEINKNAARGHATIVMWTKRAATLTNVLSDSGRRVALTLDGKAGRDTVSVNTGRAIYLKKQALSIVERDPMMFIDGVRVEPSALQSIDRSRIEKVEVIKGPSAAKLYGPDAEAGAIIIRTKKAPDKN
jgi:beta-lactamase regulating signal transducer with metallopeptidase domain